LSRDLIRSSHIFIKLSRDLISLCPSPSIACGCP
jgi:hypothetical protein